MVEKLLANSKGIVDFVFTKDDLCEVRKVSASETTLLSMLNISRFSYGLVI